MTSIASPAAAASPTRPWPAERVEQWPIERLIPYANNPRLSMSPEYPATSAARIAANLRVEAMAGQAPCSKARFR
jgi:hypothetical protein